MDTTPAIAILQDGTITNADVKPTPVVPQTSYEKIDDQTVRVTEVRILTHDDNIADVAANYTEFEQRKAEALADPTLQPVNADDFINEYQLELKGASAVGVSDADAALKELGIQ